MYYVLRVRSEDMEAVIKTFDTLAEAKEAKKLLEQELQVFHDIGYEHRTEGKQTYHIRRSQNWQISEVDEDVRDCINEGDIFQFNVAMSNMLGTSVDGYLDKRNSLLDE